MSYPNIIHTLTHITSNIHTRPSEHTGIVVGHKHTHTHIPTLTPSNTLTRPFEHTGTDVGH